MTGSKMRSRIRRVTCYVGDGPIPTCLPSFDLSDLSRPTRLVVKVPEASRCGSDSPADRGVFAVLSRCFASSGKMKGKNLVPVADR